MTFLKMLDPRVALELAVTFIIGLFLWWCAHTLISIGEDRVQTKWDAEKHAIEVQNNKINEEKRVKDDLAQKSIDDERKAKNAQIASLNVKLGTAITSLSSRPDRPGTSGVSTSAGEGRGCTGAELYRADAGFLTRETFRAEKLRIKLASCEADYAKVAAIINGTSAKQPLKQTDTATEPVATNSP